jgi:hypothetical protein
MGKVLAELLDPLVPYVDTLATSNVDIQGAGLDEPNLFPNPMLTGTGGSKSNAITGNLADSLSAQSINGSTLSNTVLSKVTRDDQLPGEWQEVAVSSAVENPRLIYTNNSPGSSSWDVGDTIWGECEFDCDSDLADLEILRLVLQVSTAGFSALAYAYATNLPPADDQASFPYENRPQNVIMRTPEIVVPATAALAFLMFEFKGTGTFRIARPAFRRRR